MQEKDNPGATGGWDFWQQAGDAERENGTGGGHAPSATPLGAAAGSSQESGVRRGGFGGGLPPVGGLPPRGGAGFPEQGNDWNALVRFYGQGGEYFGILLRNFFLSLITLGIYSFWGKTRARAYLWSRTHILGEPLEYTGTGKELFISFLIVILPFMAVSLLVSFLIQMNILVGELVLWVAILFFWQFASYKALRYRLTRTRWRGIRGNLDGSALDYAWRGALYCLAIIVSLGLAFPWASARMTELRMNNVRFGDRKFAFSGPAKELLKPFLGMYAGSMLLSAIFIGIMVMGAITGGALGYGEPPTWYILSFIGGYFALLIGLALMGAFFQAAHFRWFFRHMYFGQMLTRSTLTGLNYFKVTLSNMLLLLVTVGIGFAWTHVRRLRVCLDSIEFSGNPQLDELLQDTGSAPTRGEGLLEALDMDIGF